MPRPPRSPAGGDAPRPGRGVAAQPVVQGVPLRANAVGDALLVVQVPWNPAETLAPAAMTASHDALVIVTVWPSWWMPETPQPAPTTVWPGGRVKVTVQPLMVVVPVLVMVRFATKPPDHTVLAYCTRQVGGVARWIVRWAVAVPRAVPPLLRLTVASNPVAAHWLRVAPKVE